MTIDITNVEFLRVVLLIIILLLFMLFLILCIVLLIILCINMSRYLKIKPEANKVTAKDKTKRLEQRDFNTNDYDDIMINAKTIKKNLTAIQTGNYKNITGIKKDLKIPIDCANAILKKFANEIDEGEIL